MKKRILFFLLALQLVSLHAAEIVITPVKDPGIPGGTEYFPLFTGAKWTFAVSMNEIKSEMVWEVISYNEITDPANKLVKTPAYEVVSMEMGNWYFIIHEGYLCAYEFDGRNYNIRQVLPVKPVINGQWISEHDTMKIVSTDNETLKVEYENDEKTRFGYILYKKGTGMSEVFETSRFSDGKNIVKFELKQFKTFEETKTATQSLTNQNRSNDVTNRNTTTTSVPRSTTTTVRINTTTTTLSETSDTTIKKTYDYTRFVLRKPDPAKIYIQIGSFNIENNAIDFASGVKTTYPVYIYYDADGYFKILVEGKGDPKDFLTRIRNEIKKDAFIKRFK